MEKQAASTYIKSQHMFSRSIGGISEDKEDVFVKRFAENAQGKTYAYLKKVSLNAAKRNRDIILECPVEGVADPKTGRIAKENMTIVHAVQIEGEDTTNPEKGHEMMEEARERLLQRKYICEGQILQIGGGGKFMVPIGPLKMQRGKEALEFCAAWHQAYMTMYWECLEPIERKNGYKQQEFFDFMQMNMLYSPDGTTRPTNPMKDDDASLKPSVMRVPLYGNGLINKPERILAMILDAKEHPSKTTLQRVDEYVALSTSSNLLDSIVHDQILKHVANHFKYWGLEKRSLGAFSSCINKVISCYGREQAILLAPDISKIVGGVHRSDVAAIAAAQELANRFIPFQKMKDATRILEEITSSRSIKITPEQIELLHCWEYDSIVSSEEQCLPKRKVYEAYCLYCKAEGKEFIGSDTFFRVMKAKGYGETVKQHVKCFSNIDFILRASV